MLLISKGFISKIDKAKILDVFIISYLIVPKRIDLKVEETYVSTKDLWRRDFFLKVRKGSWSAYAGAPGLAGTGAVSTRVFVSWIEYVNRFSEETERKRSCLNHNISDAYGLWISQTTSRSHTFAPMVGSDADLCYVFHHGVWIDQFYFQWFASAFNLEAAVQHCWLYCVLGVCVCSVLHGACTVGLRFRACM